MMLKRLSSLFIVAISLFALWHSDMRTTAVDTLGRIVRTVEAWEMERLIEKARAAEVERDSIDEERGLLEETLPELGDTAVAGNVKQRIADLEDRALVPALSRGAAIRDLDALAQPHREELAIRTQGLGYLTEGSIVLISNETPAEDSSAVGSFPSESSPTESTSGECPPAESVAASPAESDDKDATVEMPVTEESAAVVTNDERQHSARPNYEPPAAAANAAPCRTVIVRQIVPARASQKSYGCR
jgi:hypothetical protein